VAVKELFDFFVDRFNDEKLSGQIKKCMKTFSLETRTE
jgi:hypothetical protein